MSGAPLLRPSIPPLLPPLMPPLLTLLLPLLPLLLHPAAGSPRLEAEPALVQHEVGAGRPPAFAWKLHPRDPLRRSLDNGTLTVVEGGVGEERLVQRGVRAARRSLVAAGLTALSCEPGHARAPPTWYRGDTPLAVPPPHPDAQVVAAGALLLVRGAAAVAEYACEARHPLTGQAQRLPAITLHAAESSAGAGTAPRLAGAPGDVSVAAGAAVCLPCVAAGHPPPQYTWYREWEGRLRPAEGAAGAWLWAGGAALCVRGVTPEHAGVWLCKAFNAFGDATARLQLSVLRPLSVTVTPALVRATAGSTVRLVCASSDLRATLTWLHDGTPAGAGAALELRAVTREHRGLYHCVARRGPDSAQAAAELQLGDSAPELVYTFIEQALRPGGDVSLRCAAAGSPPPRVTWLLDSAPLDRHRAPARYSLAEHAAPGGDVLAALNISAAAAVDGGRYTCRASNHLGIAEHSARLNIYGPPSVRALGPVRVVAGNNVTVHCPYAGYPISSVSWWRRGAGAALGGTGRAAARAAELRLSPALPQDAGHYTCVATAPDGPAARRDIEIQVRSPPKISPFMFSSELMEGSSAQVLCGVSSGDKPLYFSWLKDGAPLPASLQVEEKSLNEFSLLMFSQLSAAHSGAYTCRVTNHAASVNYTAHLSVNVPPAWVTEPQDAAVVLGAPLQMTCKASGQPAPAAGWWRRLDGTPDAEHWQALGGGWPPGLVAHNGSLAAPAAARAHQGLYRCVADNGVGPPLVKHVNVTVHEPAHLAEGGGDVSCVRGQSAALSCVALGDPPLSVQWSRGGRRLDLQSFRWAVAEARAGGGLRSTLTLRVVESGDAGEYRCHARNPHGAAERALRLAVLEPPAAPAALRLAGRGARWARLAWRAPSAATLHYTALCTPLHAARAPPAPFSLNLTLDAAEASGAGELSARVAGLHPAAAYSLRLAAANHVGHSPFSEPLVLTTLEEAPAASPQNVRVRPISSGELLISWSAPPADTWNGELLGYVAAWREIGVAGTAPGDRLAALGGRLIAPGGSSTELALAGLRAAARYELTIRSYNRAGAGPHSPPLYATMPDGVPETAPSEVSCEGLGAGSLRVRWTPPPGSAHTLRGYDIQYAPLDLPTWGAAAESGGARAGAAAEATLAGLAPATNYSVWVRARSEAGAGPASLPVRCATPAGAAGAVRAVRALAAAADAVRVTWLAPARGAVSHYTLHVREASGGGERSQRVAAAPGEQEVWRDVRGLRAAPHEAWVRAEAARGAGPPSPRVTAAPAHTVAARVSSLARVVVAAAGGRARLPCAAVGAAPLLRRWTPLPLAHSLSDAGDLDIHKVSASSAGNYTCSVRNAGGSDAAVFTLVVLRPPAAPAAPRLLRAEPAALLVGWEPAADGGAPVFSYSLRWRRASGQAGEEAGRARLPPHDAALTLPGLACGARYHVTLQAHNAVGDSPLSPPLVARTRGDKAVPAPAKEFVWANSSALRLNLLAWRTRCPVAVWSVALRPAEGGAWRELVADGESAAAGDLQPAAWYELRVLARSPAGDAAALYRAPTLSLAGESIGEPVEVAAQAPGGAPAAGGEEGSTGGGGGVWRAGAGAALLGGGAAVLLATLGGVALARRPPSWLRRECAPRPADPHPQLYSTEPSKRSRKPASPTADSAEISPYATFSAAGGAPAGGVTASCALHVRLHTFGRAEPELTAAPPPRPNLLAQEYARGRSTGSDSESSGSPCAACAAELYCAPLRPDSLPPDYVVDAACGANRSCGAGERGTRRAGRQHHLGRARRRREHARAAAEPPALRYVVAAPESSRRV